MSASIHIFETMDIPPDILLQGYDYHGHRHNYLFCKVHASHPSKPIYFRIMYSTERDVYICIETDERGFYNGMEIFCDITRDESLSMNDILWRISEYSYDIRFLKWELMERIRLLDTATDMESILEIVKQYYRNDVSTSADNSSTD